MESQVEHASRYSLFGGLGTAFASYGLNLSAVATLIGVVIGIIGLVVNVWAIRRRDQREAREHEARMKEHDHGQPKEKDVA